MNLTVSWKNIYLAILQFYKYLKPLHCITDCLQHLLIIHRVDFALKCLSHITQKVGVPIIKNMPNRL